MGILLAIHTFITLAMIGVILIQKGDNAGLGLGGGASSSMFSARGTANFFTHVTAVLAALFMINSLVMCVLSSRTIRTQTSFLDDSRP